jgi:hypothetical protein
MNAVVKTHTAFSYSRLNQFEECPKKMHAVQIAKSVKENESEAMRYGKDVHKSLEMRIKNGKKLPAHLEPLEPMMFKLANAPGLKFAEMQLAISQPTVGPSSIWPSSLVSRRCCSITRRAKSRVTSRRCA